MMPTHECDDDEPTAATFSTFFCDSKVTFEGLLELNAILYKVRLVVRWDNLCDAPALSSAVICRVVALLLLILKFTCFRSPTFFEKNAPYCLRIFPSNATL